MLVGDSMPYAAGDCAAAVHALERVEPPVEAVKLKVVAAADRAGAAADAGFTGTEAWVARQTTTSRGDAARQVALATELESGGHDATAEALDAGLVSPAHAAVILRAGRDLPAGVSEAQRQSGRGGAGGEGATVRPRPAPPDRPPRHRGRRTRPERGRRPRERADAHRGTSRPGQEPADPPRQRRRHHHRTLHHPRPGRRDPAQGDRRDDRTPTDAHTRTERPERPASTGGTAAGSPSPSSSNTCPPSTCTPRPPPPWWSPSTTPSCTAR